MPQLLVLLILVLVAPVVLMRALILLPAATLSVGWRKAVQSYRFSLLWAAMLFLYEAGNLTGFSWERGKYVGEAELRDSAVRLAYSPTYQSLSELRADYPDFTPEIRYWNGWNSEFQNSVFDKLVGLTRYQVRLPDTIAILQTNGRGVTLRGCDTAPCPRVLPAHPAIGLIVTVQLGTEPYDTVSDYVARWSDGSTDGIFRKDHCLSAWRKETDAIELIISRNDTHPVRIQPGFGYFLIGVQLMPELPVSAILGSSSQVRLEEADFLHWKSCDPALRAAWPNLGSWWKR